MGGIHGEPGKPKCAVIKVSKCGTNKAGQHCKVSMGRLAPSLTSKKMATRKAKTRLRLPKPEKHGEISNLLEADPSWGRT